MPYLHLKDFNNSHCLLNRDQSPSLAEWLFVTKPLAEAQDTLSYLTVFRNGLVLTPLPAFEYVTHVDWNAHSHPALPWRTVYSSKFSSGNPSKKSFWSTPSSWGKPSSLKADNSLSPHAFFHQTVTEHRSGYLLLISQRRGQVGGKESLLYFGGWQPWGWREANSCTEADSLCPSTTQESGARAFMERGRGLHAETAQSALTVILKLVTAGLTSVILIFLSTVNLQFQGWFVSISLRPVLRLVAVYVTATVGHHINFSTCWGFQYP